MSNVTLNRRVCFITVCKLIFLIVYVFYKSNGQLEKDETISSTGCMTRLGLIVRQSFVQHFRVVVVLILFYDGMQ